MVILHRCNNSEPRARTNSPIIREFTASEPTVEEPLSLCYRGRTYAVALIPCPFSRREKGKRPLRGFPLKLPRPARQLENAVKCVTAPKESGDKPHPQPVTATHESGAWRATFIPLAGA